MKTLAAFRSRLRGERGTTSIEYGIVASLIAVVVILAVLSLGRVTNDNIDCAGRAISERAEVCDSAAAAEGGGPSSTAPSGGSQGSGGSHAPGNNGNNGNNGNGGGNAGGKKN